MYICHCAVVTDRDVVRTIDSGASTLAELCRTTRAGQGCGRCVSTLRDLLCQHCPVARRTAADRPIEEVAGAAV